jgi:uncharacterized protein YdgA (DUF945 family)
MKKVLSVVIVLFVAVALIGPKIVGVQLASGIEDTVEVINENPNYNASISSIQSGWFSTNAEILIGLNMPQMPNQAPLDFSISLDVAAIHGPVITGDKFALAWLHSVVQTKSVELPQGVEVPNNDPIYRFEGLTGLFGATTYQDKVAQMRYTDVDTQELIAFSGLTGKGKISGSGLEYTSVTESITMGVKDMLNFEVQNLALDIESSASINQMLTQGLVDSNMSVSMPLVLFSDLTKSTEVRVTNTKLVGISEYDKPSDLGNLTMATTIASIDAPNLNLKDLNTVIEVKNIQAKFLLAYQDFSNDILANMSDPSAIQADMDAFMDTYLLEQLQAKPEYNFTDISGKINGSEFRGNLAAKIGEVTQLPANLEDTAYWMQNVIVNANMQLEKEAAEFIARTIISNQLMTNPNFAALSEQEQAQILQQQVQGTIDGLKQQGLVVLEGEEYKMAFTLQSGVATLNGTQIPM